MSTTTVFRGAVGNTLLVAVVAAALLSTGAPSAVLVAPVGPANSSAVAATNSCAVVNLTTGAGPTPSLQRMIDRASAGDRLQVRGVCQGHVTIRKDLTIVGKATSAWPQPTLHPYVDGCDEQCFVMRVAGGADTDLTVRDIKITRGNRAHGGGGIYVEGASVVLRGSTWVTDNYALWFGGGIYLSEEYSTGKVVLRGRTLVSENSSRDGGGGVFGNDVVLRGHSQVSENAAKHTAGGIRGTVVMKDHSAVLSNTSRSYAGIYGTVTMRDYARVCENTVQYANGGGIGGSVTMWDWATVCNNASDGLDDRTNNGGGVVGTVVMHGNASVKGNYANDNGGGVWCTTGSSVVLHDSASITGNTAGVDGGGVFDECGAVTLGDDSVVTGNTPNDISPQWRAAWRRVSRPG